MRVLHRLTLLLFALLLSLSLPRSSYAQSPVAWFASTRPLVGPLESVPISVNIPGYSGPASLVIYDPAGRAVGSWDFPVAASSAILHVIPRGLPGQHRAVLFASGAPVADGPIYRLDATTTIQTGNVMIDELYPRIYAFMSDARLGYFLDGHYIQGYRSPDSPLLWLRDHYYQGRGFRYFDHDVISLLDAFKRAQYADGSMPDFVARPDWNINAFRTPVEADVEYLYVQAVYEAWQMTGNDAWLLAHLPAMQRAIDYITSDPLRWEGSVGLVKRPFTIDTWDFEYGPSTLDPNTGQAAPRHWIDGQTKWGIFHGDNTGLAQALRSLARVEDYAGQPEQARQHRELADAIMGRINAWSWNGRFYLHHVKFTPFDVPGVNEAEQLSLSNAIALNRGVLTVEQARAILDEYRSRLQRRDRLAFAEWWSIDPPFPPGSFGLAGRLGERPGEYVNGGIMPLVGGELARGAFRYGYEDYGFDILQRYYRMIKQTESTFLWYYPTGGPGIGSLETIPSDGWGASAMLGALMEGAAGIEDIGVRYSDVILSPRWPAAPDVDSAYVVARYAASDSYIAYRWSHSNESNGTFLRLEATGSASVLHLRLMLPPATKGVNAVRLNGQPAAFVIDTIGTSQYVTLDAPGDIAQVEIEVRQ